MMMELVTTPTIWSQVGAIIPLLLLVGFASTILLIDVFAESTENNRYLGYLTAFFLTIVLVFVLKDLNSSITTKYLFNNSIIIDGYGLIFTAIFVVSGILTALGSIDYLEKNGIAIGEFYALMLLSISGMALMVYSRNLIVTFVALELLSLPIYVLAGLFRANKRSLEASIKYYIMGSVASAIMLYGVALLYGATGSVDIIKIGVSIDARYHNFSQLLSNDPIIIAGMFMILVGFLFKTALMPFHMWTPDVYEGAPTIVTGFMSVAVKAAAFATMLRIFSYSFNLDALLVNGGKYISNSWVNLLVILSVVTIIIANIVALVQKEVKRMLSYSAIVHAGYLMLGMSAFFISGKVEAYSSFIFYFVSYIFAGIGAFIVLGILERDDRSIRYDDLNGTAYKRPFLGIMMSIFMFSFAAIPVFAGFMGKFYLFRTAYLDANLQIPVIIALLASVISVFYYLKVTIHMYMKNFDESQDDNYNVSNASKIALTLAAIGVLFFGIFPNSVLVIIEKSFSTFIGG